MNRVLFAWGLLCVFCGPAWIIPALVGWNEQGAWRPLNTVILASGLPLVFTGLVIAFRNARQADLRSVPAPIRLAIIGNILFVAFCVLEFSDGLARQNGRVFYWTSVLFLPALALFHGLATARRWAWWMARVLAGLFTLWFAIFVLMIPFADVRSTHSGPVPWYGRLYMITVTLVFAASAACVFRSLGKSEARTYFGLHLKV